MDVSAIRALTFDVFGTVVDWRTSIAREVDAFARSHGLGLDGPAFADAWRSLYQPSMEQVRTGARPWTKLDDLHRESLLTLLDRFGVTGIAPAEIDHLNHAWHRLDPWPDVVEGLTRLKRKFIIATLSNGNVALMVNMAKRAGMPWDMILGAEVARAYKPQPRAYEAAAELLGLAPAECMMVAAHNADLHAAAKSGLRTAFVARPTEHGPGQTRDLAAEPGIDLAAGSFTELADKLGC